MHSLENPFAPKPLVPGIVEFTRELLGEEKAKAYEASQLKSQRTSRVARPTSHVEVNLDLTPEEQASLAETEVFQELQIKEMKALREFFGFHVNVPALPKEITPDMIKKWEAMGFELHYLPKMKLDEEADYPGWEKKPNLQYLDKSKLAPDFLDLPGGWLLVDAREKPAYQAGDQMYKNDPLAKALEKLRKDKIIEDFKHSKSRFNLSPEELENPIVRQALADAIGIDVENLSLSKYIEFNILGNIHHPEWGETNTSEWFADKYENGRGRLRDGGLGLGGRTSVSWGSPGDRFGEVGFRVLGRLS